MKGVPAARFDAQQTFHSLPFDAPREIGVPVDPFKQITTWVYRCPGLTRLCTRGLVTITRLNG